MGVEVAIGSAAAVSKVAISNGHCIHIFHFFLVFESRASGEAAVTSGKSGLMSSALEMLISVLSNKAVLALCIRF